MHSNKIFLKKYIFSFIKKIFFSKTDVGDIFYPWKDSRQNIIANRYIHLFTIQELKKLALDAGFMIDSYGTTYDSKSGKSRNLFLILTK